MKRKILITLGLCLTLCGCGGMAPSEPIDTQPEFGRFKLLEDEGEYRIGNYVHHQYLVADKDTDIIYIYDEMHDYNAAGVSISPFYCVNADDQPEVAMLRD